MANEEHLKKLKLRVEVWNQWRKDNLVIRPNLSHANLRGVDLSGADLSDADLSGANLSHANLFGATLSRADLRDSELRGINLRSAKLRGAILYESELRDADLSGANLVRTFLIRADFSGANLNKADLSDADLNLAVFKSTEFDNTNLSEAQTGGTSYDNCNLRGTIGLETVRHRGPSTIGIDTLVKSKGQIPERFLRGCGLSDWQIEEAKLYNPDLSNEEVNDIQYRIHDFRVRQAIQINPLFISYSHADGCFVDEIERHLTWRGVRFWRDIHHAVAGRLERQIDQAIHLNDVVLLVLSEHSTDSDWVEHEVRKAREKEKQTNKDTLCPVALDDSWKDCRWPARLREQVEKYHILDFSNWQDGGEFQRMFGKLLEGLNLFYK